MSRIQSIDRAAALMSAMADGEWHPLGKLARRVRLAKTTAFNLVNALSAAGLADHDPARGAYRLGLQNIAYGRAVERRLDVLTSLQPTMRAIWADTNETVSLAVPRATDVLIVGSIDGRPAGSESRVGMPAPYHCTALGRVILAQRTAAERRALLLNALEQMTPHTVTDPAALDTVLSLVSRDGFAVECEEMALGTCCVAVPVKAPNGALRGAIGISGPIERLDVAKMAKLGDLLLRRVAV